MDAFCFQDLDYFQRVVQIKNGFFKDTVSVGFGAHRLLDLAFRFGYWISLIVC